MFTRQEFLMGRDKEYPLDLELAFNMADTLAALNYIRGRYGKPLVGSSGYRPGKYNVAAGGADNSSHKLCLAEDFHDEPALKVMPSTPIFGKYCIDGQPYFLGEFGAWCLTNMEELKKAGLYMEHPAYTKGWVHLQKRPTSSGNRVFIPH